MKQNNLIKFAAFVSMPAGLLLSPLKMTCLSDNITGIVTYAINTDKRFRDFSYKIIDKSVDLSKNWQT